jgi:hypothetical protein
MSSEVVALLVAAVLGRQDPECIGGKVLQRGTGGLPSPFSFLFSQPALL